MAASARRLIRRRSGNGDISEQSLDSQPGEARSTGPIRQQRTPSVRLERIQRITFPDGTVYEIIDRLEH
jgi:hypothetical protein